MPEIFTLAVTDFSDSETKAKLAAELGLKPTEVSELVHMINNLKKTPSLHHKETFALYIFFA